MMVFADQGFVVVALSTASPGFGQDLTDDIQNQWGGRPYQDLILDWQYIEANSSYIDTDWAIALGASHRRYITYWVQNNDLGRKFKAIFTHDGSFSTLSKYASEEPYSMQDGFNGIL
jgi:dipeptidyl aminopeptidase/acylaminoacyl peptidase